MRRPTRALASLLCIPITAATLAAQDGPDRRPTRFDLGIHAGGGYQTAWFTTRDGEGETGWGLGLVPFVGASATYWMSPSLGLRAHGAYVASSFPESELQEFSDWVANNWIYDLNLVYRPFFRSGTTRLATSAYVFVGGGGYTFNAGESRATPCLPVPTWVVHEVCVPHEGSYGTVGQGVLGVGLEPLRIGDRTALFSELGVHAFDSPAHVTERPAAETDAEDAFTVMPRLTVGLRLSLGERLPVPDSP